MMANVAMRGETLHDFLLAHPRTKKIAAVKNAMLETIIDFLQRDMKDKGGLRRVNEFWIIENQ